MSEPTFPGRHRTGDPELSPRQRLVLAALIAMHGRHGGPVSSDRIARSRRVALSGASVRAALAELEQLGLLDRSHASAGRAPSASGWDYYVRVLLPPAPLPPAIADAIDAGLRGSEREVERLLHEAARLLGSLTRQLGLAVASTLDGDRLQTLALEELGEGRALLALELSGGSARTLVLELESPLPRRALADVQGVLRERLLGRTLGEARDLLARDPALARDSAVRIVVRATHASWSPAVGTPLLSHGAGHIAEQPEFADPGRFGPVLRTVEAGAPLEHMIAHGLGGQVGVRVGLGEARALAECSLVSFTLPGTVSGGVGVLGPLRMDYALAIAVVDRVGVRVAELLSA